MEDLKNFTTEEKKVVNRVIYLKIHCRVKS